MTAHEYKKIIPLTVDVPRELYNTVTEYQKRFKPHTSIDRLIAESIIEEIRDWFKTQDKGD